MSQPATKKSFMDLVSEGLGSISVPTLKRGAFGGSQTGYSAGSHSRKTRTWNASPLGPNTLSEINLYEIRKRSRDMIRDSTLAQSAIDKWTSNVVGNGIVPHFLYPNDNVRAQIQSAWDVWTKKSDYDGIDSFYGQQILAVRELFEAGEVFALFHVRQLGEGAKVPTKLTIQLLESEHLSEYLNQAETPEGNNIKLGIVFNSDDERIGYQFWKTQPYDNIVATNVDAGKHIFVKAEDCLHILRRTRAGQLRSQGGHMTSALIALHQIEDYDESERTKKQMSACFAMFITRLTADESNILPPDPNSAVPSSTGKNESHIQPGTVQYLEVGEDIKFPQLPESNDYPAYMSVQLHKLAAALGITYEQLTGDLKGVSFSSLRAGALEFRRSCEQYQTSIIIHQFCDPIMKRWMDEMVLNGTLNLPGYADDPTPYQAVKWVPPGWAWINPKDEVDSYIAAIRGGITSRTQVCREQGSDPELIDAQQAQERKRAAKLGLIYDSDPDKVLIGRETQPLTPTNAKPDQDSDIEAEDSDESDQESAET